MPINIKFLQAGFGDAILIQQSNSGSSFTVLIDAGFSKAYRSALGPELESLKASGKQVDLCILTHSDADHINGIFPANRRLGINWATRYWLNHSPIEPVVPVQESSISIRKAILLRDQLLPRLESEPIVEGYEIAVPNGRLFTLSPDRSQFYEWWAYWKEQEELLAKKRSLGENKSAAVSDYKTLIKDFDKKGFKEDDSFANRSSIALLYEVDHFRAIFMGDAHPSVVCRSLRNLGYDETNPIHLDLLKLSHHGSSGNTCPELLSLISCQNYAIITDGSQHHLPNKATLAQILNSANHSSSTPIRFLFNYDNLKFHSIFLPEDYNTYNFECYYPQKGKNALVIDIVETEEPIILTIS